LKAPGVDARYFEIDSYIGHSIDYGALKIAAMGTSQIRDDPGFAVLVISGAQRSFDIEAIANELARTPKLWLSYERSVQLVNG
jgi:hypothetical protein